MFRNLVRSSIVVLALGFAACDDVPTTPPVDDSEAEFDTSFDAVLPPDGGSCPDVFYEHSKLLSNGVTVTWTSVLAGFDYAEGTDYTADVKWSVDQGTATYSDFTGRKGPNTWSPKRAVDGTMSPGAAGDGTLPVTVSMMPMKEAGMAAFDGDDDDEDDDDDDGDEGDDSEWAGKIGNGHFWLRLEIDSGEGRPKRVKLGVNFHLEDPADGYGTNCPGDDPPVDPPVENQPPTANAGGDQTVTDADDGGDEDVMLDGSGSSDAEGPIASWVWSENGSQIATGETPTVTFAVGAHTVALTVADGDGATDTDEVVITVEAAPGGNQPPTANAGADQTVTDTDDGGDEDVTLDGSGSSDLEGPIASWVWSENGSQIATGETPTVTFAVGTHTVTLTVADGDGATDTDEVVITVEAAPAQNQPPTANAGPNQTVTDTDDNGGEDVTLDGSGSSDLEGPIASWVWSENGSQIATGETPTVTFAVGTHTVTLTVADGDGATDTDQVVITVDPAPPAPGVSFASDIQPYFEAGQANCVQCHSGGSGSGGVNLDTYGGVIAAEPAGALRQQLLDDHRNGPDDAGFVTILDQWVDEGAQNN